MRPQQFNLPVAPTAKGRPRVVRTKAGHSMTYTPDKTVEAEERIRWYLRNAGAKTHDGPVGVRVKFYVRRPKSAPKSQTWPSKRPDMDQFLKLLMDACNGVLWEDDSQVCYAEVWKSYAESEPLIQVEVWDI